MYKLSFYVVEDYLEPVKQAVFMAGGGCYDEFVNCCWQVKGDGQYQVEGETLTRCVEYKVELYCKNEHVEAVLSALLDTHPCNVPAYDLIEVRNSF